MAQQTQKLEELVEMFGSHPKIKIIVSPEFDKPDFRREYLDVPYQEVAERGETAIFLRLNGLKYFTNQSADRLREGTATNGEEETLVLYGERFLADRNTFIEDNLGLAYFISLKFKDLDEDEKLSKGFEVLLRALEGFDFTKGYRFSTYACNSIIRELSRYSLRAKRRNAVFREFYEEDSLGISCDTKLTKDDTPLRIELMNEVIKRNLAGLNKTELQILSQRFPSNGDGSMTFDGIGNLIGLSKERVRQIQNIALKKIECKIQQLQEAI